MAFPATPLDATVELAIGADIHADPATWSWTDVTTSIREQQKIVINRGRRNRIGNFPPARVTATADNTDGNLCRHNPLGAHFGLLKKNTPMRVSVDNGSGPVVRGAVYVTGFPPSWDPSEQDQVVTLQGVGITDRLGRSKPLRSAMFRTMTGISSDGYAPGWYWAMEDGSGASAFASGLPGGAPMAFSTGVSPAADSSMAGSLALPTFDAEASATTPALLYADTGKWVVKFAVNIAAEPASETVYAEILTASGGSSTRTTVSIVPGSPASVRVQRYDASGALLPLMTVTEPLSSPASPTEAEFFGHWAMITVASEAVTGTGDIATVLGVATADVPGALGTTTTNTTGTHTRLTGVSLRAGTACSVGHLGIYTDPVIVTSSSDWGHEALGGWDGETASDRVGRLCREEGVPCTNLGTSLQRMGPQTAGRLLDLLRECANADQGLLYEDLNFGLTFLPSTERYNLPAAITLAYGSGHILPPWDPDDDDQDYYNDVTATRPDGSPYRAADEGEIDDVGQYADSVNPNVHTDDQARDVAGWRLNLGLNDELTWPAVRPNLLLGGALLNSWLASDLGDLVYITGHPSPLAPDTIRQIIEGYSETLGAYQYSVSANLSPAAPWDVAELDDDDLGKLDTDGSELVAAVSSSATALTVLTTNVDSPLWTTDAGEMPIPLIVAGEVMSVTDVDPAFLDNFGRVTASGWGTSDSGHAWTTTGGAAADYSTTGSRGQIAFSAVGLKQTQAGGSYDDLIIVGQVLPTEVSTGAVVDQGLVVRRDATANSHYELLIRWETTSVISVRVNKVVAGAAANIASDAVGTAYSSGSIFWIKAALQGTRIRVKAWNSSASEPDWQLDFTDSAVTAAGQIGAVCRVQAGNTNIPVSPQWDAIQVTNPQVMTVTRSVNGVAKSQSAGAAVNVHRPARLAL